MTITICPKCGSMNITTAGVCENCGWSPFAQVALCTRITGEMELKVSGKALLDDYKRLLFENKSLESRIVELEEIDKLRSESVSTLNQANANNEDEIELLEKRIAKLEELAQQLVWVGNDLLADNTNPVTITLFSGLAFRSKELLP